MWLETSKTRLFFDMHLPAWPGKGIAESFDPGRIADTFAAAKADSVIAYAKCQYGNFYTKLPGEALHPGLAGIDLLEELTERLSAKGLRTIAYYSVSWDERMADEHPEWLVENVRGERGVGQYRWRTLCINGPYADLVERHIRSISGKPIDGLWIDMTIVGDGHCYCPRCRKSYFESRGRYPAESPDDPAYADFLAFRYDLVEAFYKRMRKAAREEKAAIAITNNYWGYPYSSTGMGSRAVGAAAGADFLTGEAYTDWTGIRATSFLPIFLRSVANGRPFESLVSRFVNTWDYSVKPRDFLAFECFSVFAHGATVTVDDAPYHDGRLDEALYAEDVAPTFGEIRKQLPAVAGAPLRYAAVFHSQRTKDVRTDQADFIKDISGAFRILRDLHLPVEFLFDEDLSERSLAGLALVLLPNVEALSEDEWAVLEAFIASGGFVLASGAIGSGAAARRIDELLGSVRRGWSPYSLSYLRLGDRSPRDILVRGRYVAYDFRGGRGEVIDPICETDTGTFFHNNLPAPYRPTGIPGILERKWGAGSFALFTQPIFRHYAKQPSRELREEARDLIFAHCPRPEIELRIPMKMDYSIFRDGETYYVHLLNPNVEPALCCGLMDTLDGNFERSYEYMEEVVPIHDLGILVRSEKVVSVTALREGSPVTATGGEAGTEIRVERVALWEIVKIVVGGGAS
jgi:hypothetical protein